MIIDVQQLSKHYKNHAALHDVSLQVPEGSAFLVIGENGAGKTTLIKILMNLIQSDHGAATILGVDSRDLSPKEFARIGYVSENQQLPGRLTITEYLNYLRPFYPTWDRQLEAAACKQLRLPQDRKIKDLSHGMRMKMALLCALPYRPELMILDEPFSGIDSLVRDELMEGLAGRAEEMTILMSSHELNEVEGLGTHVAFLEQGRLLFQESMETLGSRMQEIRVTLDRPAALQKPMPTNWIDAKASGNVLMFVHTQCDGNNVEAQVRAQLEGVVRIEANAMPLRNIFTSLARAAQK